VVPDLQSVAVANSRFFTIGGTAALMVSTLPHTVIEHVTLLRGEALLALTVALLWRWSTACCRAGPTTPSTRSAPP